MSALGAAFRASKVTRYWQWHRYNESRVRGGARIVLINLDETAVSFAPDLRTGFIVSKTSHQARALVKKQLTRTNVTYVAIVCDDGDIQKHMPHFIIGDKKKISQRSLSQLRLNAPANVHIVQNETKAWNNHAVMLRILTALGNCFTDSPDLQPVLILDVAQCHIHRSVLDKAKQLGLWLVFVPALITCLVQPLDTHGFFAFKSWLRRQYRALRSQSPNGLVEPFDWLQVLQSAKASFFDARSWVKAFTDTGARQPCMRLTAALNKHFAPALATNAAAAMPTMQDLAFFWPRGRRMLFAHSSLFPKEGMCPSEPRADKRPAPRQPVPPSEPAVSIALSSRSLVRACRQFPSRSVE